MSPDDFEKIESALSVQLPAAYKQLLAPFPVRYFTGNADTDVWDDASALIERNLELRSEGSRPWPKHWLFIGDPQSGCANAINLHDPAAPVSWVDQCDLSTVEGELGEPFELWLSRWQAEIRADLIADEIDPEGEPARAAEGWPEWVRMLVLYCLIITLGLGTIAGVYFLARDVISWLK